MIYGTLYIFGLNVMDEGLFEGAKCVGRERFNAKSRLMSESGSMDDAFTPTHPASR